MRAASAATQTSPIGEPATGHLAENTDTLVLALRSALYKQGIPESLYVDNGSIYTSKEITQICARIGTLLCHAPIRDGAAKGKVERFFRTVRESSLTRALDLSNIAVLNKEFTRWVEDDYHAREAVSLISLAGRACA